MPRWTASPTRPSTASSPSGTWAATSRRSPGPGTRPILGKKPATGPSRWEALAEGRQEPRRTLQADLPPQEGPDEAPLLRQEPEPGAAVGGDAEVGRADVPALHPDRLVPDDDRRLGRLLAGEREVVRGVQPLGGVPLEQMRQGEQE